MKKISQGEVEREFQKALAVEYVKNYCKKKWFINSEIKKTKLCIVR